MDIHLPPPPPPFPATNVPSWQSYTSQGLSSQSKEIAPTTVEGVNQSGFTDLAILLTQCVEDGETTACMVLWRMSMTGPLLKARLNLRLVLFYYLDRPVHRRLAVMIEREAKMAQEQSALISELQSADHRRQRVISELLASDHKRQVQLTKTLRLLKGLQTQMVEF
ncbi:hypothetical protein Tco_1539360 [Tanacetum coccineum]